MYKNGTNSLLPTFEYGTRLRTRSSLASSNTRVTIPSSSHAHIHATYLKQACGFITQTETPVLEHK
eukprot:m.31990 g.31990  ORF g.31990 m.31990 type:complete len:66 (+) comp9482_c0_seq2:1374-1571(+)